MPTTAVVFKHIKAPVSSFLSKSQFSPRSYFTKPASSIHHKRIPSTSSFRYAHADKGDLFQSEVRANVPRVWSNRAGASRSWQAEFETDSEFPLENMQIRKTTEIEVT